MKWNQYKIKTVSSAEDIIISSLTDIGIEGAQIEDNVPLTNEEKQLMFVDILPDMDVNDSTAYISFYLDTEIDNETILVKVREELEELREFLEIGDGTIEVSQTEDIDWINNWKEYFKQFYIDDILVTPSWESVKKIDEDKMIIHIDPGTAFGTGKHETTQLCIRQLKKYVNQDTVLLDVGCGSGILSMVSSKLGAKFAMMTDLDPCAITATAENMERNGISIKSYEVITGNIINDLRIQDEVGYERYDIIVANILAEVLVPLTPVIKKHLKPGGIYITSGIIDDKEETVKRVMEESELIIEEITYQGEWVSITARKAN